MWNFDIITLFPEVFEYLEYGIIGRAKKAGFFQVRFWNPRDYTSDCYRKVDDSPYGGGGGLVMLLEPLHLAICQAKLANPKAKLVYLTPQGRVLSHNLVLSLIESNKNEDRNFILISGRYEGFDERIFFKHPGEELSIGDYVLSGGELPAMVLIDTLVRQIPGVLGNENSRINESFQNKYLDYPQYTKPQIWRNLKVPEVLYSGHQANIEKWRQERSLKKTLERRPDLLIKKPMSNIERNILLKVCNKKEF